MAPVPAAVIVSLIGLYAAVTNADGVPASCSALVPNLRGVNQEPSDPAEYGKCTKALDPHVLTMGSNWCAFNSLGMWPAGPSPRAKQCAKFGRVTVYRGPVYGSEPKHKGACNMDLVGNDDRALVAVSTKYLKTSQHGWADDDGVCGQCMCIHLRGVDDEYNPGVKYHAAKNHFGLSVLAVVGDRCGECEDDHVDILLDRPFAYAPWTPKDPKENEHAAYANAMPGKRGFGDPWTMRGGDFSPESVGTWVADWQFVPCQGWNHTTCGNMFRTMGYRQVWEPQHTPGVNSTTMRQVRRPTGSRPWAVARRPAATGPLPKVVAGAMCGGMGSGCEKVRAPRQCEDVAWASCPSNTRCKRDSKWWWSCLA